MIQVQPPQRPAPKVDIERVVDAMEHGGTVVYSAHWKGRGTLLIERDHSVVMNSFFDHGARRRSYGAIRFRRNLPAYLVMLVTAGYFGVLIKTMARS